MRPVVVEAEVDISRLPEQVFDYCCDPGHEPEWNPMMKSSKKITDGRIGVGARYATEFVKGPPMVMECVGYERPSAWSLVGSSSALKAGGGGRVLPSAAGSHLIMRMELEPHGLLRLAAPLLRRRMKPMLDRDLANIKSVLEGS
jgi:polyketide cyclase/dehydrase/lipid transport protein